MTSTPVGAVEQPAPTETSVQFVVYGRPIPQGSKRHVGQGILVEQTNVKPWREAIKYAALLNMRGIQRLDCPVRAAYIFAFNRPAGHYKADGTVKTSAPRWPATRANGDIEKLVRAANDAMTDAGVWRDDSQVIAITATKTWADPDDPALHIPGVAIWVRPAVTP